MFFKLYFFFFIYVFFVYVTLHDAGAGPILKTDVKSVSRKKIRNFPMQCKTESSRVA